MTTRKKHWNAIFSAKADHELGWYERDVSQTLKFLRRIPKTGSAIIFLPGAGTSLLVDELLAVGYKLVLNDISDEALKKLRARIGRDNKSIWLHHDISKPLPEGLPLADIWIDRAVLHFLTEESDIQGYFSNLKSVIKPGGYVLLAEFSTRGATKCAGLELHRYSIEEMAMRMGPGFELLESEEYTYINPVGDPRPYIYALYKKHDG
ncbi:MAG TPA: class I SAM-dependent methyltransferase [Gammaproteobacteria bacterium]|nr:class I SAM-dependent methyltransferase [Gammaproteobacteria bacterium]